MKGIVQSYQFLGFWGYGKQSELEELLTRVFEEISSQISLQNLRIYNTEQTEYDLISDVFDLSNSAKPELYSRLRNDEIGNSFSGCGISASGLFTYKQYDGSTLPDAWVKIEENHLILGREPFGRVPLFWTKIGQIIWFASRLELLLPLLETRQVSIPALYGYSCFSYVPTPLTPVNEVLAVPAGTEIIWSSKSESKIIWQTGTRKLHEWREASPEIKDEEKAIAQLQTLLKDAIDRQITDLNDEPVGVFLSGGLDSSVVAALLVQAGVKVRAYTLNFGAAGIPEYPYAEQVAEYLKIPLVKVDAKPRQIQKALIPTVKALDLPFADGVTVPLFLLSQAASQETQIIFNGEGGDQLFAGWTNKPLIAAGIYETEHPDGEQTFVQQYLRTFHRLWGYEEQIYQPELYAQIQHLQPEDWLKDALNPVFYTSLLNRLRRATLMLKGAQNIHPRATNLGFANGLKVRSPFCDLPLAEWTFRLSGELCLKGACEKYILKKAVENWLPPDIVWRQKRGMGVPLTSWCLNELWPQMGTWLNPGRLRQENRFYPYLAEKIVEGKLGGAITGRRMGEILWLLIIWQLWRSQVLGEAANDKSWDHPFWLPNWLWRYSKRWKN
ncbi:asparagine synthetase B family protein [Aerosakkonema funiforme]|uniref:asparagine synthetase B family protein n=1 Tax=Aerosakkonema funiforme TaxID=1246630 RepID=UPI0035B8E61D